MPVPIDIPFGIPMWTFYVIHSLEFILALIAVIVLMTSDAKKVGVAMLIFLFVPVILLLSTANILGSRITFIAAHVLLIVMVILLLFARRKGEKKDEFAL